MLGFWNKSVYITYAGVFFAVMGFMLFCSTSNVNFAFCGMIIAAVCDMFDGKVARSIKNRTDEEKEFGVQIDSLGDIVAFIVVPALTIYKIGLTEYYQMIILALYIVSGVVRLAYFNVAMSDKDKAIKCFRGLPVPVAVFIFGMVWLLGKMIPCILNNQVMIYTVLVPIVGLLHISTIKIKKFTSNWFYILVTLLSILIIVLGVFVL